MSKEYEILNIPEKPEGVSYDDFFRRYFTLTPRIKGMETSKQLELLFKAQQLCSKSNRNQGQERFRERFLWRNIGGVCCHPIFIKAKHNSEILNDNRPLSEISMDGREPPTTYLNHPVPYDDDDDNLRDYFGPLPFLAKIMLDSGMVKGPHDKLERHPTYPEEFRHGDVLKLAVPWSDGNMAPGYYRNDGTYIWMVTEDYPCGYPYSLSYGPDEYGALPSLIRFSETLPPDAYVDYIAHNCHCYPDPDLMKRIIHEIKFIPVSEFRSDRKSDPPLEYDCMDYYDYTNRGEIVDDGNDYNVPYAEIDIDIDGIYKNFYVILFNGVQELAAKYPDQLVLDHIEKRMKTHGYASYLGQERCGFGTKYYIGLICLDKKLLDEEFMAYKNTQEKSSVPNSNVDN